MDAFILILVIVIPLIVGVRVLMTHQKHKNMSDAPKSIDPIEVEARRLAEQEVAMLDMMFQSTHQGSREFILLDGSTKLEDLSPFATGSSDSLYKLPGAVDETHALTPGQMNVVINYMLANYPMDSTLGFVTDQLRGKFLYGAQKDWNIVNEVVRDARSRTGDHEITPAQQMLLQGIVAALTNREPHWDEGIQGAINNLSDSTKYWLANQAVVIETRDQFTSFMSNLEGLVGRPQRKEI